MGKGQERTERISFLPFVLDAANARLYRGTEVIRLRGKPLAVLEYLARRPGQLVTKNELLEALWPGTYVTEAALAGCVRELRQALGDQRGEPQFIETVYGRGYRFIPAIQSSAAHAAPGANAVPEAPQTDHERGATAAPVASPMIGREAELDVLFTALRTAERGERQVVFVAGDTGIGKTMLVRAFVEDARRLAAEPPLLACGQCIEQYGPGEPFLPVLDGLTRLVHQSPDGDVAATVRRHVPRGLLSVAAASPDGPPSAAAPERVVRALVDTIEAVARRHTLIFWIEDLHWADPSTLDVITYLAQRPDAARLLLIVTFRPVDAIIRQHPLRIVEHELRTRRQSTQVTLRLLSPNAVTAWLEWLCPQPPPALADWLYERSNGNPLFLSAVLEDLKAAGLAQHATGAWTISPHFSQAGVPQSLRLLIDQQADRLPAEDQQLLAAASAAGVQFSAAVVAAAMGHDTVEIEERCSALARRGQFLTASGSVEWPDATVAGTYTFVHSLYQNVLYGRLPPARRQQVHARIARRLERAYGADAAESPLELAVHFEHARDVVNAVRYRERAAHRCNQRSAHREAAANLQRALELTDTLPESRDRQRQTLWLSLMLGTAMIPTAGYADAELCAIFQRCCGLAEQLGEAPQLFAALSALTPCRLARGELSAAAPMSERLLQLAEAMPLPIFRVLARATAGWACCSRGEFSAAVEYLEEALRVHAAGVPRDTINIDPATLACSALCAALLPLGRLADARTRTVGEIARCRQSDRVIDRVTALVSSSLIFAVLDEPATAETHAAEALATAADYRLREPPLADVIRAWAVAMRTDSDAALTTLLERIDAYRAAGFGTYLSAALYLAAIAHRRAGNIESTTQLVTQALAHAESTGERWCEAELYRLRGVLLLPPTAAAGTGRTRKRHDRLRAAEDWFERALDIARHQAAKLWELRAAENLAHIRHLCGRTAEARTLLEPIVSWFAHEQDAADVRRAAALLDQLR